MSSNDKSTRVNTEVSDLIESDGFTYKVLSVDQIVEIQRDIVDDVTNVLELSQQATRTILKHFKWDKEQLFENYFESSPQEFFQRVHVLNPFGETAINPTFGNTACEICYSSDQEIDGLGCGHIYCVGCWKMYLANKTCSEGLSHTITCPAPNCDILVDYITFLQLADDPLVVERYKRLITNFFVECRALMRWCTAPNCTYAIEANSMKPKAVKCKCGHQFCFACGENWHEPVSCSWLKKWLSITFTDSETYKWIAQNTKRCPQCGIAIQKDGGCEHITCTCRYQFCWLCLGKWHPGSGNCYINSALVSDLEVKARYHRYQDRYMNHMQSLKKELQLYANVQARKDVGTQYLRDAIDALCQCRSTLMYSYVFAFYLQENNQKEIFEYNQRDLETATERISNCLEQHGDKIRIIELSHYCQQRRLILLNHVREGNENQWWYFIQDTTLSAL